MAYGISNWFQGGTKEQYDAAIKVVHPADGLPEGATFHFAGETDDGDFIVVAIWDSKGSWETFRDETLLPGLQSAEGAFEGPPKTVGFEVHNSRQA
jgi:heme-degrading monooxygenase HmoA